MQVYKIHEYFLSFRFTFLSAPSNSLYIYVYSVIAKRRSCFQPFSLSLSLSYPPRIASLYRFVHNRDKSVLFDRRAKSHPTFIIIYAFLLLAPLLAAFERRQMRRLEGIKLAIRDTTRRFDLCGREPVFSTSRGRWKVNGIRRRERLWRVEIYII